MENTALSVPSTAPHNNTYETAGVDARKADAALDGFLKHLRNSWAHRDHVELDFGHFANVVNLGQIGIAISTDGIGTKAIIAQLMDKYDTVGIDCVAMNANDVLCVGAEPQSMVDYIALQQVDHTMLAEIGKGLAEGARRANITIVGGELAQLPEVLQGEAEGTGFDLAGTCIGTVDLTQIISGSRVSPGDSVIGLQSSGIHSNGLTLARKVFGLGPDEKNVGEKRRVLSQHYDELGTTLGEALLEPTRIYVKEVKALMDGDLEIRGLAHITGDGFLNLPRLEADVGYMIEEPPDPHPIFQLIQDYGSAADAEMYDVFNMGVGFCVIVPSDKATKAIAEIRGLGTEASEIGVVVEDPTRTVEITSKRLRGHRGEGFQPVG